MEGASDDVKKGLRGYLVGLLAAHIPNTVMGPSHSKIVISNSQQQQPELFKAPRTSNGTSIKISPPKINYDKIPLFEQNEKDQIFWRVESCWGRVSCADSKMLSMASNGAVPLLPL